MNKAEYLKLLKDAETKRNKLTKQTQREIRNLFLDVAKELEKKALKATPGSLEERWALEYLKSIKGDLDVIQKEIYKSTKQKVEDVVKATTDPQLSFFMSINNKYSLGLDESFKAMFSKVNTKAMEEILLGYAYKDNKGLSERIWQDFKVMDKQMHSMIEQAIIQKKSTYDFAKDLEKYVNPDAKKDYDWSKVYPNTKKKIDFNAYRLASTSISHAYQASIKRGAKKNPYVEGIVWRSALIHGRTCDVCRERHGQIYLPDNMPYDHPLGLCSHTYDIPMDLEDIGTGLRQWVDGASNSKLDNWFSEHGINFAF